MPETTRAVTDIRSHFEQLSDPRRREPTYPLLNIVVMALCAVICGADDFVAIAALNRSCEGTPVLMSRNVASQTAFDRAQRAMNDHLNWPHVGQVFELRRARTIAGQTSVEISYGVTSLDRSQASAERLLAVSRRHWGAIENGLHWVRDEAFGEDRSPIFRGHGPQNLAALSNAGLNWLRQLKTDNITATLRNFARNPLRLLRKLGYPLSIVSSAAVDDSSDPIADRPRREAALRRGGD